MIDARTTSLLVHPVEPENINLHNQTLVRYTLPSSYYARNNNKKDKFYGKVQNEIAEQLDEPYYFFTKDKPLPAIYTLVSKPQIPDVYLSDLSKEPLPEEIVSADDVRLHIFLKVLLARYIRSRRENIFTSQGKHYIQIKGSGKWLTCLEIGINGIRDEDEEVRAFRVFNHAHRFALCDKSNLGRWRAERQAFFGKMAPKDGRVLLRPLKRSEVFTYPNDLYQPKPLSQSPAKLNFHEDEKLEQARGWHTHRFMQGFVAFLTEYGLEVEFQRRCLKAYKPSSKNYELPLSKLSSVCVLDNRLNRETVPLKTYVDYLRNHFSKLAFSVIAREQLSPEIPTLVLQDYEKRDFAEDGRFAEQLDPKQELYAATKDVPKQTINVNLSDVKGEGYLEYPKPPFKDRKLHEEFCLKLNVSLDQLFLKSVVLGYLPTIYLPLFHDEKVSLHDYVFVRRSMYGIGPARQRYTVAMWTEGERLRFVDVGGADGKQALQKQLERHNVSWLADIVTKFNEYHYLQDGEKEPASYDLFITHGKVVEIENLDERVLYEYDEIMRRRRERTEPLPIDDFKLLPYAHKLSNIDARILEAYDNFLEDLKNSYARLSFRQLKNEPFLSSIDKIFSLGRTPSGSIHRRKLTDAYQKIGKFRSLKGVDVMPTFQGIWYEEGHYTVGSKMGFNKSQPKAHLVRRFAVRKGQSFDPIPLLEAMSVTFVRHGQYTVLPYPFHLIDLWADTTFG